MVSECRIVVINEETEELIINELINEELADDIVEMVEEGEVETFEECANVCDKVSEMLSEAGIETEDHDEMIAGLDGLKLVKKEEGNGGNGKKRVVKKNGK